MGNSLLRSGCFLLDQQNKKKLIEVSFLSCWCISFSVLCLRLNFTNKKIQNFRPHSWTLENLSFVFVSKPDFLEFLQASCIKKCQWIMKTSNFKYFWYFWWKFLKGLSPDHTKGSVLLAHFSDYFIAYSKDTTDILSYTKSTQTQMSKVTINQTWDKGFKNSGVDV